MRILRRPIRLLGIALGAIAGWIAAGHLGRGEPAPGEHRHPPPATRPAGPATVPARSAATQPHTAPAMPPARPSVIGRVLFDGKPPPRLPIAGIVNVPQCCQLHDSPPLDETVIVNPDGTLRNVVVYVACEVQGAGDGGDDPGGWRREIAADS